MSPISVTYMALTRAPEPCETLMLDAAADVSLRKLDVAGYLAIYREVGGPWRWDQRLRMPSAELAAYLASPASQIFCLTDQSRAPAQLGFCEFDASDVQNIQLMNFGLIPKAFGFGYGRTLLIHALSAVWQRYSPQRIWLHTDTWDHPKARELYLSAGFEIEAEKTQESEDL